MELLCEVMRGRHDLVITLVSYLTIDERLLLNLEPRKLSPHNLEVAPVPAMVRSRGSTSEWWTTTRTGTTIRLARDNRRNTYMTQVFNCDEHGLWRYARYDGDRAWSVILIMAAA
eukprot:23918-Eustigmatos_ZCMA.PRE.1